MKNKGRTFPKGAAFNFSIALNQARHGEAEAGELEGGPKRFFQAQGDVVYRREICCGRTYDAVYAGTDVWPNACGVHALFSHSSDASRDGVLHDDVGIGAYAYVYFPYDTRWFGGAGDLRDFFHQPLPYRRKKLPLQPTQYRF